MLVLRYLVYLPVFHKLRNNLRLYSSIFFCIYYILLLDFRVCCVSVFCRYVFKNACRFISIGFLFFIKDADRENVDVGKTAKHCAYSTELISFMICSCKGIHTARVKIVAPLNVFKTEFL